MFIIVSNLCIICGRRHAPQAKHANIPRLMCLLKIGFVCGNGVSTQTMLNPKKVNCTMPFNPMNRYKPL